MTGAVTVPRRLQRQKLRLADLTPAEMAEIYRSGHARELLSIGDLTAPMRLSGAIEGVQYNAYVTYRLIHVDEQGLVFMLATNADGVEIALCGKTETYATYAGTNERGICMNRKGQTGLDAPDANLDTYAKQYGPNLYGWERSYARNSVMPTTVNALPRDLQKCIVTSSIWTNNKGGNDYSWNNTTITHDKLFLLDLHEVSGITGAETAHTAQYQVQMEYFKLQGSELPVIHSILDPGKMADCFLRGPSYGDTYCFAGWYSTGERNANTKFGACTRQGMKYCFRIA